MRQKDYMALYDNMERFATYKARRYIHDESQRMDAIDEAMAEFVDSAKFTQEGDELLSPIGGVPELTAWGKGVISHTLKDYAKKKREVRPVTLWDSEKALVDNVDGFHGMELNG